MVGDTTIVIRQDGTPMVGLLEIITIHERILCTKSPQEYYAPEAVVVMEEEEVVVVVAVITTEEAAQTRIQDDFRAGNRLAEIL